MASSANSERPPKRQRPVALVTRSVLSSFIYLFCLKLLANPGQTLCSACHALSQKPCHGSAAVRKPLVCNDLQLIKSRPSALAVHRIGSFTHFRRQPRHRLRAIPQLGSLGAPASRRRVRSCGRRKRAGETPALIVHPKLFTGGEESLLFLSPRHL